LLRRWCLLHRDEGEDILLSDGHEGEDLLLGVMQPW
jgi:hypothetical protein